MKLKMNLTRPFLGILIAFLAISINACKNQDTNSDISPDINIIFLHHSTGWAIWKGNSPSLFEKAVGKISKDLAERVGKKAVLPALFQKYNAEHNTNFAIKELSFPKSNPYGWNNYPYDYYNIWVENAGTTPYLEEPTLEMLTKDYQVIIFKHCYPVSNIKPDVVAAAGDLSIKTISNYKKLYLALRDKMHEFPETKFILFTGAVQVKANLTEEEALQTREFFTWVTDEWDLPEDNIYLWDLYTLQTEGGLYFKNEYAIGPNNSHPNEEFSIKAASLLFHRIVDIMNNKGNNTSLTGEVTE